MDRLVETRHVTASNYRRISVPGGRQNGDNWLFLPQAAGGSISLPGQDARQLQWHLQTHSISTLSLAELSLTHGQVGRGLQLQIQDQVFPSIAAHINSNTQQLQICLVLASKAVALLTIPLNAASAQGSSTTSSSILDAVGHGSHMDAGWHVVQCTPQLSAVGLPSAVAVADEHLCIAGSSGSTTCISMSVLTSGNLQVLPPDTQGSMRTVVSLDPSGLVVQVKRRIGWAASLPAVAAVPVNISMSGQSQHSSLLVMHEDGSCYQWLVSQQRQGLSQQLSPAGQGKQARPHKVCVCYPQASSTRTQRNWDALLVFDLGLPDRAAQSDIRVLPLRLQREQDQTAAAARLEPLLPQPQQLQIEWPDASLVDAKVAGQQLLLLCSTATGGSAVVSYGLKDWSYQGPCQLLQQKACEWSGQQEVWSAALAAFPADIDPSSHVLSQILVPGQLCADTLRATMSYFGAQHGASELASSSLAHMQACITAAVQLIHARNPAFTPARCWHTLFAKYCELWQQQHPLMGLWASPGGWVGAVRAGGLLTVLRGVTPAEALAQETRPSVLKHVMEAAGVSISSNSGVIGGPADVAKLRICLDTLGDALGQPALRVMTQLVMTGVPVESHLLPAFVELLLQGPQLQQQQQTGKASRSSFVGDGGSFARQQQQLQEWRQQRQARLLAVHSQLAELPHALETLTGFVDLAILAATRAATQLQAPAAAASSPYPPLATSTLLSSVALHSLRATCLTLQKLLLLLGYISHIGSLGSTPLTAADHAATAADLITPLATALRSAAAALWLCKTPASAPVPGLLAKLQGSAGAGPGPLPSFRSLAASGAAPEPATGDAAADGAASAGQAGGPATWQYSLAVHMLPSFWQQQHLTAPGVSGAGLGHSADQLAVWLMLGGETDDVSKTAAVPGVIAHERWFDITGRLLSAELGAGPGVYAKTDIPLKSTQGLAGRVVLLGYRLFGAREYAAMQQLVRLVGGESPSEAGLQYILGLSIACSSKAGSAVHLDAAVGYLFRAAAGLCSSDAGPLRLVLQLLRQQQLQEQQQQGGPSLQFSAAATGMDTDADGAHAVAGKAAFGGDGAEGTGAQRRQQQQQQEALLRLQFDQAVMLLFEQKGIKEGALAFARAALSVAEEAFGPDQQHEKLQEQAHLWSSIFNMAFELGLVEDAYTAALSNPQHDLAEDKIRRLVLNLVEQGQLQQLLSLPWAGVLTLEREKLSEPVPVVEVVIDRLVSSACFSQPRGLDLEPLSSYQILYDCVMAWGHYKHAAAAMLAFARRLRGMAAAAAAGGSSSSQADRRQTRQVVTEVQAAYDACISLLQLLDPADAWLDPTQRLLQQYQVPAPTTGSSRRPAATAAGDATSSPFLPSGRRLQAAGGSAQHQQQSAEQALQKQQQPPSLQEQQQELPAVLTLSDLQREAALFTAAAALQQKGAGLEASALMGYGLDVGWLFDQLVGQGLLPEALQLAHAVYSGQQLLQQLEVAAAELAGQCADMQRHSQQLGADLDDVQQQEGFGESSMLAGGPGKAASGLRSSVLTPVGPGYLCSEAAAGWAKLRRLLQWYDTFDCVSPAADRAAVGAAAAGGKAPAASDAGDASTSSNSNGATGSITLVGARLRLAAVDGVLSTQPRMALPAWLLKPFQPAVGLGGMAGAAADPAGLLRKLMEDWRLTDAAELAMSYLDAWLQESSLHRVHSTAVWLPLQDMELLHASLQDGARRAREKGAEAEAALLGGYAVSLQEKLQQHMSLVKSDWGQLQQSAA